MARRPFTGAAGFFVVWGFTLARKANDRLESNPTGLQASALIPHGKASPSAPTTPSSFLWRFNSFQGFTFRGLPGLFPVQPYSAQRGV